MEAGLLQGKSDFTQNIVRKSTTLALRMRIKALKFHE